MAQFDNGQWLNQYVAPQLLKEFRDYNADFIGVLRPAPRAAINADGIRFNELINNVGFYVNNTEPFLPKRLKGKKGIVEWEKYDTDPTAVDDAEIRSLAYDPRSEVRVLHREAFELGMRDHVLWKLAPEDSNNKAMPVVRTTGPDDGTGRKRLTFADLVKYLETVKGLRLPYKDQFYLVLNDQHATDLILDRDSANYFTNQNIFFDPATGNVRSVMGFKFFENNNTPLYSSSGVKRPARAISQTGDQLSSVFFYAPNTVYHLERTKILYKTEITDTRNANPTSEYRTQTYGMVDRILDTGVGAIISANV